MANAEFVYRMEDVLDLYTCLLDPQHPVICMDETSKQLISEILSPVPVKPGQPAKHDYQYRRGGVCNLFMFTEPLTGWREVMIRERRTKKDWVHCMKTLLDDHYSEAKIVRVVLDNLNTHVPSAFYEVLEPAEAKRLLDRLEFHYTPKHASWLNIAEIELSVLTRQCLKRRIPDQQHLQREVNAWVKKRNNHCKKVDWQFTTFDARVRLKKLYPSFSR